MVMATCYYGCQENIGQLEHPETQQQLGGTLVNFSFNISVATNIRSQAPHPPSPPQDCLQYDDRWLGCENKVVWTPDPSGRRKKGMENNLAQIWYVLLLECLGFSWVQIKNKGTRSPAQILNTMLRQNSLVRMLLWYSRSCRVTSY